MTDVERVEAWLRSSLPPMAGRGPSRDLWPVLMSRRAPVTWSWIDIGMAAVVAIVLLMFPDWLWLLAYHL